MIGVKRKKSLIARHGLIKKCNHALRAYKLSNVLTIHDHKIIEWEGKSNFWPQSLFGVI